MKRAFDSALALIGLALSGPLSLVCASLIKLEDGGPVFYTQERVGRGGRVFRALKFRSMRPDAESETGPLQARRGDPRVTRVGRMMRATAMDELPQLWNILRGDMSFVGPRALRPGEIEKEGTRLVALEAVPGYVQRIAVRPGLTGIAQVYARRDIPRRYKFKYDALYVRHQSFWLAIRLIMLSFLIIFRGTRVKAGRKY